MFFSSPLQTKHRSVSSPRVKLVEVGCERRDGHFPSRLEAQGAVELKGSAPGGQTREWSLLRELLEEQDLYLQDPGSGRELRD